MLRRKRGTQQRKDTALENIYHPKKNVYRKMNIKGASGVGSEGNKEHVIGNWQKIYPPIQRQKIHLACVL